MNAKTIQTFYILGLQFTKQSIRKKKKKKKSIKVLKNSLEHHFDNSKMDEMAWAQDIFPRCLGWNHNLKHRYSFTQNFETELKVCCSI